MGRFFVCVTMAEKRRARLFTLWKYKLLQLKD